MKNNIYNLDVIVEQEKNIYTKITNAEISKESIVEQTRMADVCCKSLFELTPKYNSLQEQYKRKPNVVVNVLVGMYVFGNICCVLAFVYLCVYLEITPDLSEELVRKALVNIFVVSLFIFVICVIPICIVIHRKSRKSNEKKKSLLLKQIKEIKSDMEELIIKNIDVISIIPEQYRYPLATNYIYEVLSNGRADSMKEALNLYEEQLHRWKMENQMQVMLKNQKSIMHSTFR